MKTSMAATAILAIVASSALASGPMIQQGVRELNLAGSMDNDGADLGATVAGKVGYFVADGTEAGITGLLGFRGSNNQTVAAGVFGQYNVYLNGPVVPYGGASFTLNWMKWSFAGERDSDGFLGASVEGGVKFFFVDYAAITLGLQLEYATKEIYNGFQDNTDWVFTLGTSWYF